MIFNDAKDVINPLLPNVPQRERLVKILILI